MTVSKWAVHSLKNFVEAHVSDYDTPFDALYEYTKNLEEAKAQDIHIDFHPEKNTLIVYGNGKGLDAEALNQIRVGIGKSGKGVTHHGLGILAFMRFAKKMVMFSRKNGQLYVLSCMGDQDEVVSDVGDAREAGSEEREYEHYYRKLNKFGDKADGTITIIEGVGKYKSDRFDFTFKMEEEFESKKFLKWFQLKASFSILERNYFLKKDEHSKPVRIEAKLGTGIKLNFTIPSAKYPADSIPGKNKNVFEYNGRWFSLTVKFVFCVSQSNDGEIQISENHQNGIAFRDAIKWKIAPDSVYKNPNYTKYLRGAIDFVIKPMDGGVGLNVYSGTRSSLIMDGEFGNCLSNILNMADVDVIRPKLQNMEKSSKSRKDDRRSQELAKDMDNFFRDNRALFDDIITTKSHGPVQNAAYVKCPNCKLTVVPKRGGSVKDIIREKNTIFAPEDVQVYICGSCTKRWPRRAYEIHTPSGEPNKLPLYKEPLPGQGAERVRKRGRGYRYSVCPFDKTDTRRALYAEHDSLVKINRDHFDYRQVEIQAKKEIGFYERQLTVDVILRHEMAGASTIEYSKKMSEAMIALTVWYYTKRPFCKSVDEDVEDEVVTAPVSAPVAMAVKEPIKIIRRVPPVITPVAVKDAVQSLGKRWGAKVR